jgi:tight adherence protein C
MVDAPHHIGVGVIAAVMAGAWAALVVWGAWRARVTMAVDARLPVLTVNPTGDDAVAATTIINAGERPALRWATPRVRRLAVPMLLGAVLLPVLPAAAPLVAAVAWAIDVRRRRAVARLAEASLIDGLPEVVDLLALAAASGMTVPTAVASVGRRGVGPVADALRDVASECDLGRRCSDSLDDLPDRLGEPVRPLVATLVAADRYGAPLAASLTRLAGEVRNDRRRRAQEAAGRIPIKLLFPLVSCVLPAFGLLTIAPLLAGALRSLRL